MFCLTNPPKKVIYAKKKDIDQRDLGIESARTEEKTGEAPLTGALLCSSLLLKPDPYNQQHKGLPSRRATRIDSE